MSRRRRSLLLPLTASWAGLFIVACTYDWDGVSAKDQGGTGGAAEGGRVETGGSVEGGGGGRGGVSGGGAAGSAAAGGAPSAGGNGGASTGGVRVGGGGGVAGAATGAVAGSVAEGGTGASVAGGVAGSVAGGGTGASGGVGGTGASGGAGGSDGGVAGGGALSVGGTGGIPTGGTGGSAGGGTGGVAGATGTCPGNLLTNPGFENSLTGWYKLAETNGTNGIWKVQSDVRSSGDLALFIDTTKAAPPVPTYQLVIGSSPLTASPGDSFDLTAVAQGADGGDGYPSMGIQFYSSSGDAIPDPELLELRGATMVPVGPVTATAPETTKNFGVVFVLPNDAVLYIDDLCLVRR